MISRALSLMLAGGLAGLIAWAIIEPSAPRDFFDTLGWKNWEVRMGITEGCFIGGFLGALSGWWQGSRTQVLIGIAIGVVGGAVMGPFAIRLGGKVFEAINGPLHGGLGTVLIARIIGWSIFGGALGVPVGLVGRSVSRTLQGAVGGLLGGALGGLGFELSGQIVGAATAAAQGGNEVGTIPRAIGLTLIGAGIGLMIGVVESVSRKATIRLVLGRNEGKDWAIDAVQSFIGRSEMAHVPLLGDPNIAPQHAAIVRRNNAYELHDLGTPMGTGLNGARIHTAMLNHGDTIQIGNFQLQFLLRSGGSVARAPIAAMPMQPAAMPTQGIPAMTSQPTQAMPSTSQPTQAMSAPTAAVLIGTSGPLAGQRIAVNALIEAGREASGIMMASDPMASRRHASLAPTAGGIMVSDLGSKNGTLVNGQKISTQIVRSGDTIQIGSSIFRVE